MTSLHTFNHLDAEAARLIISPCLNVDRWIDTIVEHRPYATAEELFDTARTAATPFTAVELEAALSRHPRIGQKANGSSAEAELSRSEQSGLDLDPEVARRLEEGNRAYKQRFGRVFLIRAAGRSSSQILDHLQARLVNDVDTEDTVVGEQLRQIAVLRLAAAVTS